MNPVTLSPCCNCVWITGPGWKVIIFKYLWRLPWWLPLVAKSTTRVLCLMQRDGETSVKIMMTDGWLQAPLHVAVINPIVHYPSGTTRSDDQFSRTKRHRPCLVSQWRALQQKESSLRSDTINKIRHDQWQSWWQRKPCSASWQRRICFVLFSF